MLLAAPESVQKHQIEILVSTNTLTIMKRVNDADCCVLADPPTPRNTWHTS